jgi:hypothetical protein
MPIAKNVMRILKGWGRMAIGDFRAFAQSVCTKMSENSELFPKPPVVLAVLQSDLDRLVSLIGEASYNDSRRIIQRDTLRNEIHVMLRQLAHYVEDLCDAETDRTTQNYLVAHSGFKAMSDTVSPAEFLLSQIKGIDNPRKGVLHVRYTSAGRDARQYQIRMAVTDHAGSGFMADFHISECEGRRNLRESDSRRFLHLPGARYEPAGCW